MANASTPLSPSPRVRSALPLSQGLSRWVPSWAYALAFWAWHHPPASPAAQQASKWGGSASPFKIPFRQGALQAYHWGTEGPVVLLCHDWGRSALHMGPLVFPLLAAGYQVLAFDAPAQGKSPGHQLGFYGWAEAINSVLRFEGHIQCLVAHGEACAPALYALRNATPLRGAVFLAPDDPRKRLKRFARRVGLPKDQRVALTHYVTRRQGQSPEDLPLAELIGDQEHRALVLHDPLDDVVPLADGREVAQHLGVPLETLEHVGHEGLVHHAAAMTRVVGFLGPAQRAY